MKRSPYNCSTSYTWEECGLYGDATATFIIDGIAVPCDRGDYHTPPSGGNVEDLRYRLQSVTVDGLTVTQFGDQERRCWENDVKDIIEIYPPLYEEIENALLADRADRDECDKESAAEARMETIRERQ